VITEAEARAWLAAYGQAWITRDPARIVELFTADALYRERRFRPPLYGTEAIRDYWRVLVYDLQRDIAFDVDEVIVSGDLAIAHWRAHFMWRPSYSVHELDAMSRITFASESRNGLRLASGFEEWIENRET
jgi:ketosteroid isomerase-like protein